MPFILLRPHSLPKFASGISDKKFRKSERVFQKFLRDTISKFRKDSENLKATLSVARLLSDFLNPFSVENLKRFRNSSRNLANLFKSIRLFLAAKSIFVLLKLTGEKAAERSWVVAPATGATRQLAHSTRTRTSAAPAAAPPLAIGPCCRWGSSCNNDPRQKLQRRPTAEAATMTNGRSCNDDQQQKLQR